MSIGDLVVLAIWVAWPLAWWKAFFLVFGNGDGISGSALVREDLSG